MTALPLTTIISTSMGRADHIRRSLPTWLALPWPAWIMVVDYGCPSNTASVVRKIAQQTASSRISAINVAPDLSTYTVPLFNKPRALNAALRSLPTGDRWLLFLDADTLMGGSFPGWWEGFVAAGSSRRMLVVEPSADTRDLTGVLGVRRAELAAIGGFDEGMSGWGSEDLDVRLRLYQSGVIPAWLPPGHLSSIPHSDELRTAFYLEKDRTRSNEKNFQRLIEKRPDQALEVGALLKDQTARKLLGVGLSRA
jgi:hypothetical protein